MTPEQILILESMWCNLTQLEYIYIYIYIYTAFIDKLYFTFITYIEVLFNVFLVYYHHQQFTVQQIRSSHKVNGFDNIFLTVKRTQMCYITGSEWFVHISTKLMQCKWIRNYPQLWLIRSIFSNFIKFHRNETNTILFYDIDVLELFVSVNVRCTCDKYLKSIKSRFANSSCADGVFCCAGDCDSCKNSMHHR